MIIRFPAVVLMTVLICILDILASSAISGKEPVRTQVYPDDSYSRPFEDHINAFETRGCSPGDSLLDRASKFHENSMVLVQRKGGWSTRWRIQSKGVDTASLSAECPLIRRRPVSFSFRVFNNSSHPVSVKAQYAEYPWHPGPAIQAVEWVLGKPETVGAWQERTVEFRFSEAHWDGRTVPKKPRFPGVMRLSVSGLQKDTKYELYLNDYTYKYPPARDVYATKIECPPMLTAGQHIEFNVHAKGSITGRVVDIEVRREPWVIWRTRLNTTEVAKLSRGRCHVRRVVPFFLSDGRATVGLVVNGFRVEAPLKTILITNRSHPKLPTVERRPHNGRPTLFVNGKAFSWSGYQCTDWQPGNVNDFGRSGTKVLTIQCDLGRLCTRPGVYDYGAIDEQAATALTANPKAMIFLAITLRLPPIWDQTHTDELVRIATNSTTMVWEEGLGNRVGSLASRVWYSEQELELLKLLRYCKSQPWANRLLGMWLMGEVTSEWFAWGSNDGQFADYSRPNQERFTSWAAEHKIKVDPAGNSIPLPAARRCPGYDFYPSSPEHALAGAYNRYYADLTADTICRLARAVKRETGGRTLVAVFYGYLIQLAGEFRGPIGGNFALKRLLAEPSVDVIGGVPLHNFRDLINGYSTYVSATESILNSGKLYCDDNDLFSWLHPMHWYREYNPKNPRMGAIQMQRRETANNAVHGAGNEWFSLMASWHHDIGLQADLSRQIKVAEAALELNRTPCDEIAFVVDEQTFGWACPESTYLNRTNTQLLFHCGRTGAPVGVWLFSDMDEIPSRVKMLVIACVNAADPKDIAKLVEAIKKGGRTILVVGAPGLINPVTGLWQPKAVSDILDLPIQIEDAAMPAGMMFSSDGSPVTVTEDKVRPRAVMEGEGTLRYADGKCAGAMRSLANGGRLIWCGTPPLSTTLLRQWALEAGVHCYAPQDYTVYVSRELVSVTGPRGEQAKLTWPKNVDIHDLFDGWKGSGKEIICPFQAGQTRLFQVRQQVKTRIPRD